MHSCCCFFFSFFFAILLFCHATELRSADLPGKAQLAGSVLSGIPSTCLDYSEDVDTDASVFGLGVQAGGRTPPYYENKA